MTPIRQDTAQADPFAAAMAGSGFTQDPYPLYASLREQQPFYRSPQGIVHLSRYADVDAALRDPRLSNDRDRLARSISERGGGGETLSRLMQKLGRVMTNTDPPAHARLRKLVNKAFSAGRVRDFRPRIEAIADRLLDAVEAQGPGFDLVSAYAYPLTTTVLCEFVGVPAREQAQVIGWSHALENPADAGLGVERIEAIIDRLYGYLRGLIAERRATPRDDFISALLAVEEGGDRLDEDELVNACFVLLGSGYESTMNLIGNAVLTLLRHPDPLARLRAEPTLLRPAIEEVLRYEGPSLQVIRSVAEPFEIAGGQLREGELVYLLLGAANRDPARFPDPDRFDIARADNRHVSFGVGIHFCLGAGLARLEGEVAVAALLRRFPGLRLATGTLEWRTNPALRGLTRLPLAF